MLKMDLRTIDERCVWMAAGLVTYKLCDREYECNICPFDRAMRGEYGEAETDESPFFQIDYRKFYHPKHLWVRIDGPSRVAIGLDRLSASVFPKIKSIVFPKPGDKFLQDEVFCHIIEERGIAPLSSPISGTVISLNGSLKNEPQLLVEDPEGDGYLLKMKPENVERDIKKLLSGRDAISWLKREERKLVRILSSLDRRVPGETMQDGGTFFPSAISGINERDYQVLIETFFVRP